VLVYPLASFCLAFLSGAGPDPSYPETGFPNSGDGTAGLQPCSAAVNWAQPSGGFGNGVLHRGGPASADLPYRSWGTRTTLWIDEGEPQHMGATRTGLVKEQGQSLSLYGAIACPRACPRGPIPPAAGMTAGQDTTAYEHYPRLAWRAYDSINLFGRRPERVIPWCCSASPRSSALALRLSRLRDPQRQLNTVNQQDA
jgi:hypothetical protein